MDDVGIKLEGDASRNDLTDGSLIAKPRLLIVRNAEPYVVARTDRDFLQDLGSDNRILLTLNALGIRLVGYVDSFESAVS